MRILAFLGFLVVYAAWIWASNAVTNLAKREILSNKTFWPAELNILLLLAALFTFIFVLSGYFNWSLVGAFFGAAQIGVVLTAILDGLLGSTTSKWGPRAVWAGGEFGMKHAPLTLGIIATTMLFVIAYPVAAGISYFGLPSEEVPARIFQYSVSVVFLAGYPLLLFVLIGTLVSENLDEATRTRFFVCQLSGLVPNALWVALLFWSFGIAGNEQKLSVANVSLEFSPPLLAVLIGFFVLTVLIPYLIGAQRAKQWRTMLLEARKSWMVKLVDILESPAGSLYLTRLAALNADLDNEIAKFAGGDLMIAAGIKIDRGVIPIGMEEIVPAYQLARGEDPRFKHLALLGQMSEKIDEVRTDLGKLVTERDLEKAAKEWIKYLHPRLAELTKELDQAGKTRTPALLIFSSAIVPIISVVLSEFAKWVWTYFSKSLPQ